MNPLDIVWGAHVVAGLTALTVFWMTLRKSAALTRPRGRFYVLAMMIVTVTAIMLLLFSRITVGLYAIYVKAPVTSRDAVLAVARATMTAAKYCVLITVDETGQPQARVPDPRIRAHRATSDVADARAGRRGRSRALPIDSSSIP